MPNSVTVDVDIDAPAATVFDFITDFRNASTFMYGLESLTPLTEQTKGLGAKYEGSIKLGVSLSSSLEVIEYVEGEKFTMDSFKGIKNTSHWTVVPVDEGHSRAVLVWDYDLGGGLAGKALGKVVEPVVKIAAAHSSKELKKAIEAL